MSYTVKSFTVATLIVFGSVASITPIQTSAQDAAGCPDQSPELLESRVTTLFDAWNDEDLELLATVHAPDMIYHWGIGEDTQGIAPYLEAAAAFFEAIDDTITIEDIITADDVVVVRWTSTGTQNQPYMAFGVSEQPANWSGIHIFKFRCGLISETWAEVDHLGRLQQQQLLPVIE